MRNAFFFQIKFGKECVFLLLKFGIDEFLSHKEFDNSSNFTVENYRIILGLFKEFCSENQIVELGSITPGIIKSFLRYSKSQLNNQPSIQVEST